MWGWILLSLAWAVYLQEASCNWLVCVWGWAWLLLLPAKLIIGRKCPQWLLVCMWEQNWLLFLLTHAANWWKLSHKATGPDCLCELTLCLGSWISFPLGVRIGTADYFILFSILSFYFCMIFSFPVYKWYFQFYSALTFFDFNHAVFSYFSSFFPFLFLFQSK